MNDEMTAKEIAAIKPTLDILDAMAETWCDAMGIVQKVRSIPVNCSTVEFQERAYTLILRHVKQAHVEGLYSGHKSTQREVQSQLAAAQARIEKLEQRLEIDSVRNVDGTKAIIPAHQRDDLPDGIYCRERTIAALEERLTAAQAENERLRSVVSRAGQQFRYYERQHLAKTPPDTGKAGTNCNYAEMCEEALAPKAPGGA